MELFLVLIPVTLALVVLSVWAFVWSTRNEQFEDLDKQAWSILFDEADAPEPEPEPEPEPVKNTQTEPEGDKAP